LVGEGSLSPRDLRTRQEELTVPTRSHKLRETLEELRAELGSAASLDPQLRARLEHTVRQIQEAIDRVPPGGEIRSGDASLAERVSESARHFEATHPEIAAALGRVIDALAALGI
jgi:hypothetical protein